MQENQGRDWHRLARFVVNRRVQLGYRHQKDFAEASGIKIRTLNNIENARRTGYAADTLAMLEQALGWEPGSVDTVLEGGDPHHPSPGRAPATLDETARLLAWLRQELQRPGADRDYLEEAIRVAEALRSQAMRREVLDFIEVRQRHA